MSRNKKILLCSDLDRTILPNGPQPESPQARSRLHVLAQHPEITLAYVSGRHLALLQEAIEEFQIPVPDYAIGDVGTTIYEIQGDDWRPWEEWEREIAPDWNGHTHAQLTALLHGVDNLRLQEPEKQNTFKLSYYAPEETDPRAVCDEIHQRLADEGVRASLIWSIDELAGTGLLDILPARATKLHAVEFLMQRKQFNRHHTVFAGDSGNDLPVLTSNLQSVLVANARDDVRAEALAAAPPASLYLAKGDFLGMNGNYSAGVLEGLAHFIPETEEWMR